MKPEITTLKIDMASEQIEVRKTPTTALSLEQKIGGFGKAVHDQEAHLAAHPDLTDAYDPRNMLNIDIGFTTGSSLMTAHRTCFSGLSPLKSSKISAGTPTPGGPARFTNGLMYSTASGDLGAAIRQAGIDSIQIVGRHATPVYLHIENGEMTLFDATDLIGKTTHEKIIALASKHDGAAYAAIGPASEHGVRYGAIAFSTSDQLKRGSKHMRFGGRGGFGAVMASKNILGIVAKGDPKNKLDLGSIAPWNKEIATGPKTEKYRKYGTYGYNIEAADANKAGIYDNFSHNKDARVMSLAREQIKEQGIKVNSKGCTACGIKCWKEVEKDGKALGKIDYEPGSLLGPNLGLYDITQTMELIEITDMLGMDGISAGVSLGFEMDRQGRFGDFAFAKELLLKIANGEHDLKDGVFRYAPGAPNAMHAKGIEFPAYLGNLNPGYAFAIGGGHMTMDTYNSWCYRDEKGNATNSVEEWIENIVRGPQMMLYDMNGICKFAKVDFSQVAELYNRVYGESVTPDDLRTVTKLTQLRVRRIDESRGFGPEDDVLPAACHKDLGFMIPHFNTPEFFSAVKEGVYARYAQMTREYAAKGWL